MRLSTILSEYTNKLPRQIESFIDKDRYAYSEEDLTDETILVRHGDYIEISIGTIILNFQCSICNDTLTYKAKGATHCLIINDNIISIDCLFECVEQETCKKCQETIQAWFIVELDDLFASSPSAKVLKASFKLPQFIKFKSENEDIYSQLLMKADFAYNERLGAGSIIYLRTIFEKLTHDVAKEKGINEIYTPKGKLKPFEQMLIKVDEKCSIIPKLYKENGYTLFRKLSEIAHGNSTEEEALKNYTSLKRLVQGILDNVNTQRIQEKNTKEIKEALATLNIKQEVVNE